MNCYWFNIRLLWWHFQIYKGHLFRVHVRYNNLKWLTVIFEPGRVCCFNPIIGWRLRNDTSYVPTD